MLSSSSRIVIVMILAFVFVTLMALVLVQQIDELNSIFDGVGFQFPLYGRLRDVVYAKHTNKIMSIFGYRLVRADRTDDQKGGGVTPYSNNDVSFKVLAK
jgi:hypothetical protein